MTAANLTQVRIVKNNAAYGEYPTGTPEMQIIPISRESMELRAENLESPVIDSSRHTSDTFRVGVQEEGDLEFPVAYGAGFEPLVEYALYSPSEVAAVVKSNITLTVTASSKTIAGTNIGVSVLVGDWIRVYMNGASTNNGFWRVDTTSTNSLTVSGGTGTLIDASSVTGCTVVRGAYWNAATTASEVYMEKQLSVATNPILAMPGLFVRRFRIETARKGFVNCRLNFFGKNEDRLATTKGDGTPNPYSSNIIMNTVDHVKYVFGAGSARSVLDLSDFNLELNNNQRPKEVQGVFGPTDILVGSISINGGVTAYADNSNLSTIMDAFHDQTEVGGALLAHDASASPFGNAYLFDVPALKYQAAPVHTEGKNTDHYIRATWAAKKKTEGGVAYMMRVFSFDP